MVMCACGWDGQTVQYKYTGRVPTCAVCSAATVCSGKNNLLLTMASYHVKEICLTNNIVMYTCDSMILSLVTLALGSYLQKTDSNLHPFIIGSDMAMTNKNHRWNFENIDTVHTYM